MSINIARPTYKTANNVKTPSLPILLLIHTISYINVAFRVADRKAPNASEASR